MDVQRPRGYADLGIAQEMERGEAARAVPVESVVAAEIRGPELRHPARIARFDRSLQRRHVPAQRLPGRPPPPPRGPPHPHSPHAPPPPPPPPTSPPAPPPAHPPPPPPLTPP